MKQREILAQDTCLLNLINSLPELSKLFEDAQARIGFNAYIDCERSDKHIFQVPKVPCVSNFASEEERIAARREYDKARYRIEHPNVMTLEERAQRQENIRRDFATGKFSVPELVEKYSVERSLIHKLVRDIPVESAHVTRIAERREAIIADFKRGMSKADLAEKYDYTTAGIDLVLKSVGLSARGRIASRNQPILDDFNRGMSYKELAFKYSMNLSTIYSIIGRATEPEDV